MTNGRGREGECLSPHVLVKNEDNSARVFRGSFNTQERFDWKTGDDEEELSFDGLGRRIDDEVEEEENNEFIDQTNSPQDESVRIDQDDLK